MVDSIPTWYYKRILIDYNRSGNKPSWNQKILRYRAWTSSSINSLCPKLLTHRKLRLLYGLEKIFSVIVFYEYIEIEIRSANTEHIWKIIFFLGDFFSLLFFHCRQDDLTIWRYLTECIFFKVLTIEIIVFLRTDGRPHGTIRSWNFPACFLKFEFSSSAFRSIFRLGFEPRTRSSIGRGSRTHLCCTVSVYHNIDKSAFFFPRTFDAIFDDLKIIFQSWYDGTFSKSRVISFPSIIIFIGVDPFLGFFLGCFECSFWQSIFEHHIFYFNAGRNWIFCFPIFIPIERIFGFYLRNKNSPQTIIHIVNRYDYKSTIFFVVTMHTIFYSKW